MTKHFVLCHSWANIRINKKERKNFFNNCFFSGSILRREFQWLERYFAHYFSGCEDSSVKGKCFFILLSGFIHLNMEKSDFQTAHISDFALWLLVWGSLNITTFLMWLNINPPSPNPFSSLEGKVDCWKLFKSFCVWVKMEAFHNLNVTSLWTLHILQCNRTRIDTFCGIFLAEGMSTFSLNFKSFQLLTNYNFCSNLVRGGKTSREENSLGKEWKLEKISTSIILSVFWGESMLFTARRPTRWILPVVLCSSQESGFTYSHVHLLHVDVKLNCLFLGWSCMSLTAVWGWIGSFNISLGCLMLGPAMSVLCASCEDTSSADRYLGMARA